ncbi:hypothetical protein CEXT_778051 [Caerostris extrusa]|uniref:Uncharacterized protein n=1 Tax=Caerostris extrusa TaxID=172846 RepID=A0AAV4RB92_CAEEX|nr:hypothetical protein CEXT_778051 [Caerostris extrusa]
MGQRFSLKRLTPRWERPFKGKKSVGPLTFKSRVVHGKDLVSRLLAQLTDPVVEAICGREDIILHAEMLKRSKTPVPLHGQQKSHIHVFRLSAYRALICTKTK